jgi:hypothetical protein
VILPLVSTFAVVAALDRMVGRDFHYLLGKKAESLLMR